MFRPAFGFAQHPKVGWNTQHLWAAVSNAKDVGIKQIRNNMFLSSGIADCFANFFDEQVKKIVNNTTMDQNVLTGNSK